MNKLQSIALVAIVVGIVVTSTLSLLSLLGYAPLRLAVVPAPVEYSAAVYLPSQSLVCPGDTLSYTNTLTVKTDEPIIVWFVASWFDVEHGMFVGPAPQTVGYRPFLRSFQSTQQRDIVIPQLVPGRYEYWFAAQRSASQASAHAVPFVIRDDCAPNT